ncbi:hypothetical protein JTF04_11500 [Mammaliicoccus vitulinus]|uniref:hypothetical protein n=1 Tax=Mammaliicoccus vitulinus TaxID=71237 RepID=UPI00194F0AB7|nr:hypothetical protein [Mammaliicoccus vitulinus]MBM6630311.1 hypothetical protein [Mammaliicoccus vitulinus]
MNLLKAIGQALVKNLVAVLFLCGLTIINVATYLQFDLTIGLFLTGFSLILIALIYQFEQANS